MKCARCDQPIEPGQLYHEAIRAGDLSIRNREAVLVHDYPCPARIVIVDGHLFPDGVGQGSVRYWSLGPMSLMVQAPVQLGTTDEPSD